MERDRESGDLESNMRERERARKIGQRKRISLLGHIHMRKKERERVRGGYSITSY